MSCRYFNCILPAGTYSVQPLKFGLNVKGGTVIMYHTALYLRYSQVWFGNLLLPLVAHILSMANFIGETLGLILKYHYHPLACPFHLNIEAGQRFCVLTPYSVPRTSYMIEPKRILGRLEIYYIYSRYLYSIPPGAHTVDCSQGSTEYDGPPVKARIISSPLFKISRKFLGYILYSVRRITKLGAAV